MVDVLHNGVVKKKAVQRRCPLLQIIKYGYGKNGRMEFLYDKFPQSKVLLSPIKGYLFVKSVRWNRDDPVVTSEDLEEMEWLANDVMETLEFYESRKNARKQIR